MILGKIMQKIFKNANIVNIENGEIRNLDILVENGKICEFDHIEKNCEQVDLKGAYVLPNFVNVFCHSLKAFEKTYGRFANKKLSESAIQLMLVKNLLAGAICNDLVHESNGFMLENVAEKSEKELSDLSESVAQSKKHLFTRVGQTLDELGTIDKIYKKPLSQVLEEFGFLDRKSVVVGGNCFEKDELELLSQYDCDFCLTVSEDGKFGRRPTNLLQLDDRFCVGIGSGYSFEIDFFAYMRQILMTQRGLFEDKNVISEQQLLQMATYNGARILTGEKNQLEVGSFANFMVIKKEISLYNDIFKTLVWEKSKKDVAMTVINGEIVQKNGQILMKNLPSYDKILTKIIENR